MCYWEENILSKQIEIPYSPMVFLSIPLNELSWARALHFDVDDAATAVGSVHSSEYALAAE